MQNYSHVILGKATAQKYPPDSTYWLASKVVFSPEKIDIEIEPGFVAGREDLAHTPTLKPLGEFIKPVEQHTLMNHVLVSSGTFYRINGQYLVTQRTANALHDPSAWTTPAGRCDYLPAVTGLRETLEEIEVIQLDSNRKLIPEPCVPHANGEFDVLKSKISGMPGPHSDFYEVITHFQGEVVESTTAWAWFDSETNTLELRLMIDCEYDHIENLKFSNPEYHTKTQLVSEESLKILPCTPTLEYFLKIR